MSNFNYNKVILGGRLTADPELKQTSNGIPVVSFSVAVNRKYQRDSQGPQADFFNVTAWRSTAEFVSRYFRKGSSICITGSIQNRSWNDAQGVKHYATDIVADEVQFVDSRGDGASQGGQMSSDSDMNPAYSTPEQSAPKFEEVKVDDDLPF